MQHVLFVGLSTVDVVYDVDEFPVANTKVAAKSQSVFAGGPATNAAIACAHLGSNAALVTVVGRNAMASVIREELQKHLVQLIDLNPDFEDSPVISAVTVDKAGNRNVVSANAMRVTAPPARVDPELCRQARIVMVDGHYKEACQAWAAAAQACGTPVVGTRTGGIPDAVREGEGGWLIDQDDAALGCTRSCGGWS